MDRAQFIEQIATIDRQLYQLREQMRPMEVTGARNQLTEDDRRRHEVLRQELQRLADRKAELRIELIKA